MIYTKNGDSGFSKNAKNYTYQKDNVLFDILGTLDELSSNMGFVKLYATSIVSEITEAYQKEFIKFSGYIAGAGSFDTSSAVSRMEQLIDAYSKKVSLNGEFTVSGKSMAGTYLDVCRTIARRLERCAVKGNKIYLIKKEDLSYFNRISDLLYILARYEDLSGGVKRQTENTDSVVSADSLDLQNAEALIKSVMAKAREMGVLTVCAVCDKGGNLITLKRDDDAYIASVKIAQDKAYTAVSLKMPTYKLENLTKPGESLYGIQHQDNRIVVFGGGIPLYNNEGKIIGGFGVSGGTLEQDTFLGDYADKIFNSKL